MLPGDPPSLFWSIKSRFVRSETKIFLILCHRLSAFKESNEEFVAEAADILLRNFNRRLPLSEEIIASAIVDPSIQHLETVVEWISEHKTTR